MRLACILLCMMVSGCTTSYVSFLGQCVVADTELAGFSVRQRVLCHGDDYMAAYLGFKHLEDVDQVIERPGRELLHWKDGPKPQEFIIDRWFEGMEQ